MPARGPRPTLHMFSQPAFTASPLPPAPGTVGLTYSAYRRARLKKRDRALITTSSSDAASHSSAPQANADLCIHLRHGPLSSVWRILRQRYTLRTAYIIAKALFSSVWRTRHSIITSSPTAARFGWRLEVLDLRRRLSTSSCSMSRAASSVHRPTRVNSRFNSIEARKPQGHLHTLCTTWRRRNWRWAGLRGVAHGSPAR